MKSVEQQYIIEHLNPKTDKVLSWLEKQTNLRTNYGRMLSGEVQGRLLTTLVKISKAQKILEIGTFTGYSSICLSQGLSENGHLDALEINDELEDLIREAWERAGVENKTTLHIGDAKETLQKIREELLSKKSEKDYYDFVFIDANKREYEDYYNLVFDILKSGAIIVVDDVLWSGKVYADKIDTDKQTQAIISFNDMIAKDERVESLILPIRDGFQIIRKK